MTLRKQTLGKKIFRFLYDPIIMGPTCTIPTSYQWPLDIVPYTALTNHHDDSKSSITHHSPVVVFVRPFIPPPNAHIAPRRDRIGRPHQRRVVQHRHSREKPADQRGIRADQHGGSGHAAGILLVVRGKAWQAQAEAGRGAARGAASGE